MVVELLTVSFIAAALAGIAVFVATRRWHFGIVVGGGCFVLAMLLLVARESSRPSHVDAAQLPAVVSDQGYVGSRSCRACHPHHHATWHDSYHRKMTQVASPESVLGDFDDVELMIEGRKYRLFRDKEKFLVEMDDPDGATEDFFGAQVREGRIVKPVLLTTGSHHMQMYWFSSDRGRMLQKFPFVYLTAEDRWVPRSGVYVSPSREGIPLYEALDTGDWNANCIRCHTTLGQPRIDWSSATADTHVAEFGISCESCHGPGGEHVRHYQDPLARYQKHLFARESEDASIVNPARLSPEASAQVCGQCHGVNAFYSNDDGEIWNQKGYPYRPGGDLSETRYTVRGNQDKEKDWVCELLEENPILMESTFWDDDKVRVSGREYNGLIASGCAQHGDMTCLSCHVMHQTQNDPRPVAEWANDQLGAGMLGDQACLQCHASEIEDIPAHTHHPIGSTGSRCYNCHMPHTTYGLLKAIRSHTIYSPSIRESVEFGRPNACNLCHLDKSLDWTADYLQKWYGHDRPELEEDDRKVAAAANWLLKGDAAQRALLAWHLAWAPARDTAGTEWMTPYLAEMLVDPYEAVRYLAGKAMRQQSGFAEFQYDYVGGDAQLTEARERALQIWQRQLPIHSLRGKQELLFDRDGLPLEKEFERLGRQRDDRQVVLQE